jgi:3-methyladenine DNA glycosylase AlkD
MIFSNCRKSKNMDQLQLLKKKLRVEANPERAKIFQRFFKTGPGEYGEGDVFIGLTTPQMRLLSKEFRNLPLRDITQLLESPIHEERSLALAIMIMQFQKADEEMQKVLYDFYLSHTKHINNWDLVDISAGNIVGPYLDGKGTKVLEKLAHSKNIWERRIAMIATYHYIRHGRSKEALEIAEILVHDTHDLIHKAVGWMLREVGKRCGEEAEESFLKKYYQTMPRTMLRYAIERFPDKKKKFYMKKS